MQSDLERIKRDLEAIASFNRTPGQGYTRFSYSEEDQKARAYLLKQMQERAMEVKLDAVGNIRALYNPQNLKTPSVMMGSHIDTVLHGGKFDGLLGVVAALEVIRTIDDHAIALAHPLELVIWAEEEGSNAGITMMGSKAMIGAYKPKDLKNISSLQGSSMYEQIKEFGLNPQETGQATFQRGQAKALLELHVEQGAVLEANQKEIGVVEAIAGMKTYKVTLEGVANHAGSTPMHLRKDALAAAAQIIAQVEQAVVEHGLNTAVATVGKILCAPNVPNIIPGVVELYIDIRDVKETGKEAVARAILKKIEDVAKARRLPCQVEEIGASSSVHLCPQVVEVVEEAAKELGYAYQRMHSGAVHDCAMLAPFTDVGMIFVPSKEGRSHCPQEYTSEEQIHKGVNVLLKAALALATHP